MEANKTYDILDLQKMEVPDLIKVAKTFGLIAHLWPKQTIIYSILNEQAKQLEKAQNKVVITGLYGCSCHPFDSWDECEAMHNQKPNVGDKVKNRHTGLEGDIFEIHPEKGFVTVKYGELASDQHLEHVATLIKL